MSDISKLAANAARVGGFSFKATSNQPNIRAGRGREYFAQQTQAYGLENGGIADNAYDAMCQGLNPDAWYEYMPVRIRANPASVASTGEMMPDDWMRIHILAPAGFTYISPGAYITFGGNTWIVYKSYNMSVGLGQAIIRRCNAVIKKYDYYGNVLEIPMSYSKMGTLGNASHATENSIIAQNYISCVCQINELSADFKENTRLLLGNSAYAMRGVNNFTREFTADGQSVHQMTFTIQLTEDLPQDDFETGVADGKSFSWELRASASEKMSVGSTQTISTTSVRNGKITASTTSYPIEYKYSSSDTSVLTVSNSGVITAIKAGNATVTVALVENDNIKTAISVNVGAATSGIQFIKTASKIKRFQSAVISAAYFNAGTQTANALTFTFGGAEKDCYSATLTGTNEYTITCYALASKPLTITATYGTYSESINIDLTE